MIVNDAGGYQNVPKQIDQIEAAILQKPDALLLWSTDPTAVVPAVEKAKAAGIKLVGFVQPPDTPAEFTVTGDFTLDGETMATSLFEKMGGSGKAMVILGGAGSAYQAALKKGWDTALTSYPDIEVVADETIPDFDPSKVQSAVENQLVRNPDLAGVMTTTTAMAASASDALASAGLAGKAVRRRPDPRRLRSDPAPPGGPPGDRARRPGRLLRPLGDGQHDQDARGRAG